MNFQNKICKLIFLTFFLIMVMPAARATGAMTDYCVIPPFVTNSIPPNVLIVLDNSGSMRTQAYPTAYDPTQFDSGQYYGYFDPNELYQYTGNGRWEITGLALTSGTVANPIASGDFLNWATMRRIDVAKKLLIGGKASPRSPSGSITVKLLGYDATTYAFSKDFDNTSVPGTIYPFVGNYRYSMSRDDLTISPLASGSSQENVYPTGDISVASQWTISGAGTAAAAVDEDPSDGSTTYIYNPGNTANDNVILDYSYTPAISGTIQDVTIVVRARKTGSQTRRIRGIVRVNGTDYPSGNARLRTSWRTYNFTFTTNPDTGLAWQWSDFKPDPLVQLDGFGVDTDRNNSSSNRTEVTQVYLQVNVATPSGGPYNTIVDQGMKKATGIMDTLKSDVRFGLSYYNTSEGAHVDEYVDFGAPVNMITSIHNMNPSTWTPLAETLYEMTRYFRQDDPPYYFSSDYSVLSNATRDPYYYQYTKLAGSNLPDQYVPCAKSFVLMLTDGESTQDQNIPSAYRDYDNDGNDPGSYGSNGSDYLDDVALWARTADARPGTCTTVPTSFNQCIPGEQNIILYSVFMFGRGSSLLQDAAINGGFVDQNLDGLPGPAYSEYLRDSNKDSVLDPATDLPLTYFEGSDGYELEKSILRAISEILRRASAGSAVSVLASGEEKGANMIQAVFYPEKSYGNPGNEKDIAWTGRMQNLWFYIDPNVGVSNIREDTIRDRVLDLDEDYISLLYFDDIENKTRAALCHDVTGDGKADSDDDGNCDSPQSTVDFEELKNLWEVGEMLFVRPAGDRVIYTNLGDDTSLDLIPSTDATINAFVASSDSTTGLDVWELLDAANNNVAREILKYVRGEESMGYCSVTDATLCNTDTDCPSGEICNRRSRQVTMDVKACSGDPTKGCTIDADCVAFGGSCTVQTLTNTWKLADVISSTPRIVSWLENNDYYNRYRDLTYRQLLNTNDYRNRGTVLVGANDGMLHSIRLGNINAIRDVMDKTRVEELLGAGLGKEEWGFIPKHSLPYLKYLMDEQYCHIYYIDATPYVVDASINWHSDCQAGGGVSRDDYHLCNKQLTTDGSNNMDFDNSSWRTIVIGSMRIGGACKALPDPDGVAVPVNTGTVEVGYSSYFALDITKSLTDPSQPPELLWEFTDPALGVSSSGPIVGRLNATAGGVEVKSRNGKWFVVITSGPTGPIETGDHKFMGTSDQAMKIFILDLAGDGSNPGKAKVLRTIDTGLAPLNLAPSFGNTSFNSLVDLEWKDGVYEDYDDDVIYLGYTEGVSSGPSFDFQEGKGGVLRLVTNGDITGAAWQATKFITTDSPITSTLVKARDDYGWGGRFWVFFGTGRYFYRDDMPQAREYLVGVSDPCYDSIDREIDMAMPNCGSVLTLGDLWNATDNPKDEAFVTDNANHPHCQAPDPCNAPYYGWKVKLNCSHDDNNPWCEYTHTDSLSGERVITHPLAVGFGNKSLVYFTSFSPTDDPCSFGGLTYLWAVDHATGDAPDLSLLQGKALIQVSTGEIKEINLKDAFTERVSLSGEMRGRRTVGFKGVPPTGQGLSVIVAPKALKRILHIMER